MDDTRPRRVGSLFTGGGGLDYGLELAGFETAWQVEWDPWNLHLLEHGWGGRWRDVTRYADIRDVDFRCVEPVDVVSGGFPCQPSSVAGRRRGQADDRWLWPEFARAIRELRPRWVVIENVAGLLQPLRDGGTVVGVAPVDDVLGDLAEGGYDAEWTCFPASGLGAPHHRDRVWIVAYPADAAGDRLGRRPPLESWTTGRPAGDRPGEMADAADGGCDRLSRIEGSPATGRGWPRERRDARRVGALADAQGAAVAARLRAGEPPAVGRRRSRAGGGAGVLPDAARLRDGRFGRRARCAAPARSVEAIPGWLSGALADAARLGVEGDGSDWLVIPPAPALAVLLGRYGAGPGSELWAAEPAVGRMAHGVARRGDRLWTLGNGVVPSVAEVVGWLIRLAELRLATAAAA